MQGNTNLPAENESTKSGNKCWDDPFHICVIHQNLQSIGNCLDHLIELLKDHGNCRFLCVTEHWKTSQQLVNYGIPGYFLASSFCRKGGGYGGSAIYAKLGVRNSVRGDLNKFAVESHFEICACEFRFDDVNILVMTIYRTPDSDVKLFMSKLEEVLSVVSNGNVNRQMLVIAGDFNINLLKEYSVKDDFNSLLKSFGVFPTIFGVTRKNKKNSSCIDNILINWEHNYSAEIINSLISDHTAQKLSFSLKKPDPVYSLRRSFSVGSKNHFRNLLEMMKWDSVYDIPECQVDQQWNCFMHLFSDAFNLSFPLRRACNSVKPIVREHTPEVEKCKKRLDLLYTIKTVDSRYKPLYDIVKKRYNSLLINNRADSYHTRIKASDNKTKCVWQIVREIKGGQGNDDSMQINGDAKTVANEYSDFLSNIPKQLQSRLTHVTVSTTIEQNERTIYLKPVDVQELVNIVSKLKNKMSCGHDGVPACILKYTIHQIVDPLLWIVNNSLAHGIFPEGLETALIKLLYKKGDKSKIDNYRPVSLLPVFSKIFETVMYSRMVNFLTLCNAFTDTQHGYLKGKSTHTAIFSFTRKIYDALERSDLAMGLFLDLSKAYDCIDHEILLSKLEKYGIRGKALQWCRSYLSKRKQIVCIPCHGDIIKSDPKQIQVGIPQGSIIGPLFFILYINDLCHVNTGGTNCTITSYADDTNLLVTADTFPELTLQADKIVRLCEVWFANNKLTLNREKTNCIFFKTSHSKIVTPDSITVNNMTISLAKDTRFLGVQVDETLSWERHVEQLSSRLSSVCYGTRVISKYVSLATLRIIYFANFESLVRYGVVFYGGSSHLDVIFKAQKRILRIMLRLGFRESCRGKFRSNKILTVSAVYIQECLLFFHKNKHYFSRFLAQAVYDTRTLNYNYPAHRLTLTEKSVLYRCIKFFNTLPTSIQVVTELTEFKKRIYEMLLELEPYSIADYLLEDF